MHDSHNRMPTSKSSKSLSQMPPVRYNRPAPPSTSDLPRVPYPSHQSFERVSISSLTNAVDNARITSSALPVDGPPTSPPEPSSHFARHSSTQASEPNRDSSRHRHSTHFQANTTQVSPGHGNLDDLSVRRKKVQSEKKRMWRKNLTPDQKAKRQELDAQRKREQRLNMTLEQRSEARRKDANRKALKRRHQKEQQLLVGAENLGPMHSRPLPTSSSSSPTSPPPRYLQRHTPLPQQPDRSSRRDSHLTPQSPPVDYDSAAMQRSRIHDLLN